MKSVKVKQSPIGRGVYAARSFQFGDVIGLVKGKLIDNLKHKPSEYSVDMGQNRSLETRPPFKYLNHSCEPNCELL